jgi:threonine dehydratase
MTAIWQQFSKEISEVVKQAGKSIVAVDGRSGRTSSGILWRSDSILTASHTIRRDANKHVREVIAGKRVVLLLCGGNIDPNVLSRVIERGLVADGRLCRFTAMISDRPYRAESERTSA